jgi:hypothetical protein
MTAYLEVWRPAGVESVALGGERATLGSGPSNRICISDDRAVSRLHALVENYGSGWTVRDLGSRNGTYVNGRRVLGERALQTGDQLLVGKTRIVFHERGRANAPKVTAVIGGGDRPELTPRERDVLHALCRPLASSAPFPQPASIRAIAAELVVTQAAVKQHLLNLYAKFGLDDPSESRRVRLANEAVLRGMLNLDELRQHPPDTSG